MIDNKPEIEIPANKGTGQTEGASPPSEIRGTQEAPPFGKRPAFRDLRRELKEEELANPGVQKLILDELERADIECDRYKEYMERFHEADKRASVLQEKLKTTAALEIYYGVGLALGGAIIGISPFFWEKKEQGVIALILGAVLIVGSAIGRLIKR